MNKSRKALRKRNSRKGNVKSKKNARKSRKGKNLKKIGGTVYITDENKIKNFRKENIFEIKEGNTAEFYYVPLQGLEFLNTFFSIRHLLLVVKNDSSETPSYMIFFRSVDAPRRQSSHSLVVLGSSFSLDSSLLPWDDSSP